MHDFLARTNNFSFGEAHYPTSGAFGPLRNRYVQLIAMHQGSARVRSDDSETVVGTGQCCVFRNMRQFFVQFESERGAHVTWCEGGVSGSPDAETARLPFTPTCIPLSTRIASLQTIGTKLHGSTSSNLNMVRNALGRSVLLAYFYEAQAIPARQAMPSSVTKTAEFIDRNFHRPISIGVLARRAELTPQYLLTLFRQNIGVTPIQYLWKVRAARGLFLLQQTTLPVAEIAYRCGYKNQSHFSRHIAENNGMSPREIRVSNNYHLSSHIAEWHCGLARGDIATIST